MRVVSLFAGIEGFGLGFERAGFEVVGQVEIDPWCRKVLGRHYPDTPKHDDITTAHGMMFGPAEVVTFGFPCQDVSSAGKRAGLEGARSGLFYEALRFIREMQEATKGEYPRFAVLENVPGIYSSNGGRDFAAVLANLVGGAVSVPGDKWRNAGVAAGPSGHAAWRTLDSQYHGVPQRRRRVFLVTDFRSERAGEVLFESKSVRRNPKPRTEAGEGATGDSRAGAESCYWDGGQIADTLASSVSAKQQTMPDKRRFMAVLEPCELVGHGEYKQGSVGTLRAGGGDAGGGSETLLPIAFDSKAHESRSLNPSHLSPSLEGQGKVAICFNPNQEGMAISETAAPTVGASQGGNNQGVVAIQHASIGRKPEAGPQGKGWRDDGVTWTLDSRGSADVVAMKLGTTDGLASTVTASAGHHGRSSPRGDGSDNLVATPYAVRRLMPVEAELLQGFPPDWTRYIEDGLEIADTHRYKMCGNAVTVNVSEAIARRMVDVLLAQRL